ncbi:hypothetical protein [Mesorhizobium sp. B2-3-4]|uniref:hypothetical protein n=1 Tax=Mesorhizobium sp. B2-3-4 TaxID=2589959 RepID=UPI00112B7D5D|nr:hypothetical protein [Mesorhizobium sp. B2-3-4]TPM29951.1 hypothetical protein FJ967_27110 [Mesorhizobium sp. B2-3-4]
MFDRPILMQTEALYPVVPDSAAANSIARELVRLFQNGITEAAMLMIAVRARWKADWTLEGSSAA